MIMDFKLEHEIKLPETIFDARFHPHSDTNLLAATTVAGDVHLIESGNVKTRLRRHHKGSAIRKVRFTNDGRMVTIAKTIKIYDLEANETAQTIKYKEVLSPYYAIQTFGNNIISAGDDDGGFYVWDIRTPEKPIFTSQDCEQYISDIDGKYENRKLIVCTSGEGTLTAYDMRAMKMIEPQSELFEAGFQCVRLVDVNKKVIIGGEDGSVYVFNQNEWAHTSGKFAITSDTRNRGKCSIDGIEILPDSSIVLAGCSDGKLRSFTLWPHRILTETVFCKRSPIESIHLNPNEDQAQLVLSGENYLNIIKYEENDDEDQEKDDGSRSASNNTSPTLSTSIESTNGKSTPPTDENKPKKQKTDTDDYLNIFN